MRFFEDKSFTRFLSIKTIGIRSATVKGFNIYDTNVSKIPLLVIKLNQYRITKK